MNKAILVGNLTKDPELTQTSTGIAVCKFTLAVQRRFTNADGQRDTDFLPIIVWRGAAENCAKYLFKGSKAGVVGSVQTRSYDAKDGTRRYVTEIIADEVEFLSTKREDDGYTPAPQESRRKRPDELEQVDDDDPFDLPF